MRLKKKLVFALFYHNKWEEHFFLQAVQAYCHQNFCSSCVKCTIYSFEQTTQDSLESHKSHKFENYAICLTQLCFSYVTYDLNEQP